MASVRACSVYGMTSLVPRSIRSLSGKYDNAAASTPVGHGSFHRPLLTRIEFDAFDLCQRHRFGYSVASYEVDVVVS